MVFISRDVVFHETTFPFISPNHTSPHSTLTFPHLFPPSQHLQSLSILTCLSLLITLQIPYLSLLNLSWTLVNLLLLILQVLMILQNLNLSCHLLLHHLLFLCLLFLFLEENHKGCLNPLPICNLISVVLLLVTSLFSPLNPTR